MVDYSEKVVLVTGSASGIGAAVARSFAGAGAAVVVNSVTSKDAGTKLARSLPKAVYVQGDIGEEKDCERLVKATVEEFGRLDVLVNNAGTTVEIPHSDLDAVTAEVWRKILDVNVIGTWQMVRAAAPELRRHGSGSVVNVSSLAGARPLGSSIPYASSKAAVNHMTVLLAKALGPDIRVNAVAPGLIDTPWTADWELQREFVSQVAPLKRTGKPEDIAEVVLSIAGAAYTTGQVVLVDGGLSLA